MTLLKTLAITAIFIITCNQLSAKQQNDTATSDRDWFITDAISVSETQSLAIIQHKKSETGVVLLNNMGGVLWKQPFDGCVIGISKHKDHYLVLRR